MADLLTQTGPLLLTPKMTQAELGIGNSLFFELIRSGELRSVKIGRKRLVPRAAITEFIAKLEAEAAASQAASA